jgi:protein O-mannosyl-transferase
MNRRKVVSLSLLLFVLVVGIFIPCLRNGFVNLDDNIYIYANARVQQGLTWHNIGWAFANLEAGFWHPLTWLSILLDSTLFGMWPGGHHLTSVLLHAFSTVILFWLLRRMTGASWRSAAVAAFFGIHPLNVEPVAWAASRKDVLSALFFLLTLLAYVRYAQAGSAKDAESETRSRRCGTNSEGDRKPEIRIHESGASAEDHDSPVTHHVSRFTFHVSCFYLLALLFFALGLMSKAMVLTVPIVLLLMDWWPLRRFQGLRPGERSKIVQRLVWEKVPFVAASVVCVLLTLRAERAVGALRTAGEFPFLYRLENAAISFAAYLYQMVSPRELAVFYPSPRSFAAGALVAAVVLVAAVSILALRTAHNRPYLAFGWAWYLATLLPMCGLVQVGSHSRADRYAYVPLIGIFLIVAWGVCDLTRRWQLQRPLLALMASLAMLLCMAAARRQLGYWADTVTLMRHALAVTSNNAFTQNVLGMALAEDGRAAEGIPHLEEAVRLAPAFWEAQNNLGTALARQGRFDEALPHLEAAVRLEPNAVEGRRGLADLLMARGRLEDAVLQYQETIRLSPGDPGAHHSLGMIFAMRGQLNDSVAQFQEAAKLEPGDPRVQCHLGIALGKQGRLDEAISRLQEALRLDPNSAEAHCNLGGAFAAKARWEKAISHFQQALKLRPDYPEAERSLRAAKELAAGAASTSRPAKGR